MRLKQPVLWLLLFFLVSHAQAADWPMRFANKQRTGTYVGAKIRPPLVEKWRYQPDEYSLALVDPGPIVEGLTLYQFTPGVAGDKIIHALDKRSGIQTWQALVLGGGAGGSYLNCFSLDREHFYYSDGIPSGPIVDHMVKMRISDQARIWQVGRNLWIQSVMPAGSLVYGLHRSDGGLWGPSATIFCVDDESGDINWELPITPMFWSTGYALSWHNGVVFAPGMPFYAIRDNAGYPDIKWTHDWPRKGSYLAGNPMVANGKVYCLFTATITGKIGLEVMDEETGELEWRLYIPGLVDGGLSAIDGLRIYVSSGTIYGIEDKGSSGEVVWQRYLGDTYFKLDLHVANNIIYKRICPGDGTYYINALDGANGDIVWAYRTDEEISSMAFSDGLLYAYGGLPVIHCFGKPIHPHLSVDQETAVPGDSVTYTITVNSYGGPSANITLVETLPSELEFVSASDGGGVTGSVVSWNNLAITADALKDVTLTTRVKAGISSGIHELAPTAFLTYPGASLFKDVESEAAATTVSATPLSPTSLVANDTCAAVELAWQASISAGIDGYKVYRTLTPGGALTLIATLAASANTYQDSSVKPNQTYYYVLTSVSDGLESVHSNEAGMLHAQCAEPLTGHVRVFPNPFNPDRAVRGTVKFEVSGAASVRIYTSRGLKAWEGEIAAPGIIEWDGKNKEGKRVSPATYLWVVEGEDWQERGSLVVE